MARRAACGIWSNENCCFVLLRDLTKAPVGPPLDEAALSWGDREFATLAIPQVRALTGLTDLEPLEIDVDDRPE